MSHDSHSNTNNNEPKEVSFTTPLILGLVTVFILVMFMSLGDPCPDKCCCKEECSKECAEACEKGGHEMKHEADTKEGHSATEGKDGKEHGEAAAAATTDTIKSELPAEAEKKEEAHH